MDFRKKWYEVLESQEDVAVLTEEAKNLTYKELSLKYEVSVTKLRWVLGMYGIKPKPAERQTGIIRSDIAHWARTFNGGKLRHVYYDMLKRCHNPENKGYASYGARGVTVCDEWLNNRLAFFQWAKDNGYEAGKTIDRIDNNKGYSPDNCRWTTWKVQMQNRRNTIWISWKGEKKTLKDWSEELGIDYSTLKDRIYRYHWSVEKAFTEKVQEH